ncbi:carbon storage regulator [Alkalihalobacillus xiaoxiensis]|uniref:Carbon storage regulator n=1 Tax=Shouchella xiaoxiensis TaxID=766895 RepID=A0ABS2SVK6_9BACI|nr:carbon storage regulator [Shouchella xiaoxiensis]MBM7839569.1 carbon storage regulator [Shouchella xiaoxiensis]
MNSKKYELATRKTKGLALMRKEDQGILIGDDIRITITEVNGAQVKVLVDAPKQVSVQRLELVLEEFEKE